MYQRMKDMCLPLNGASGPGIDTEIFLSNPDLQGDCIDFLTRLSREKFSLYISGLMDHIGYSDSMIKERQQQFRELDVITNELNDNKSERTHELGDSTATLNTFATGSKAEGIAMVYESDFDQMLIINDVICADNPQDFMHEQNITLFQTERGQETPPGYTRLRLVGTLKMDLSQSLISAGKGLAYLSSLFFHKMFMNLRKKHGLGHKMYTLLEPHGPSSPYSSKHFDRDNVFCFRCFCPDLLDRWIQRDRNHGWPPLALIHEVSLLDGHVVPVGSKGSENMYREWRICYTPAELHLRQNLNETQLKVCILLKKIFKSVLNAVSDEMTSYIVKNIVLWICEEKGLQMFAKHQLMDRLFDCIHYLRACIKNENLPSYMIPERNLLAGRLDIQQRHRLVDLLGDLLRDGGRMLLRCDRIRDAILVMYREPSMFREFCEKRDQLERLVFTEFSSITRMGVDSKRNPQLSSQNELFEQALEIHMRICQLLQFDIQTPALSEKTTEEMADLCHSRLKNILS